MGGAATILPQISTHTHYTPFRFFRHWLSFHAAITLGHRSLPFALGPIDILRGQGVSARFIG